MPLLPLVPKRDGGFASFTNTPTPTRRSFITKSGEPKTHSGGFLRMVRSSLNQLNHLQCRFRRMGHPQIPAHSYTFFFNAYFITARTFRAPARPLHPAPGVRSNLVHGLGYTFPVLLLIWRYRESHPRDRGVEERNT